MMRVVSLNVNNFGGHETKPRYDEYRYDRTRLFDFWNDIQRFDIAERIIERMLSYEPDLLVFHEFDIGSPAGKKAMEKLEQQSYFPIYPNGESEQEYRRSYSSITLMFSRCQTISSKKSPNRTKVRRWNEIVMNDMRIIGLHIPYDLLFWDEVINSYCQHKNEKTMYIGDFNVSDDPLPQNMKYRQKMDKLLAMGAIDAWLGMGHLMDTPTFIANTRIDYAVVSPLAFDRLQKIEIDSTLMSELVTDHSIVITDFK